MCKKHFLSRSSYHDSLQGYAGAMQCGKQKEDHVTTEDDDGYDVDSGKKGSSMAKGLLGS